MTTDNLTATLHACAAGLCHVEAGVALLARNGTFLHCHDFTSRFIQHDASSRTPMAAIDWDAAVTALDGGGLPRSGGGRRTLLLSASLAVGTPVSLRDTITGIDDRNVDLLITAIRHTAGNSSLPLPPWTQ